MIQQFFKKHRKKIIRGIGLALVLVSLYFIAGGIYLLGSNSGVRDEEGFSETWHARVKRDSCAVVFKPDADWILDEKGMTDIQAATESPVSQTFVAKIRAENSNPEQEIFVGLADKDDVTAYLNDVRYHLVEGMNLFPPGIKTEFSDGPAGGSADTPASQGFWTEVSDGESVLWIPKDGTAVVVMNADGSAGIDARITVLSDQAFTSFIGISNLMVLGIPLLMLGVFIMLSTRPHRSGMFPRPMTMQPEK